MPFRRRSLALPTVLALSLAFTAACRTGTNETSSPAGYTPGLGEIMTLQQMRHVKLWFAGEAGNWALADYEVKELGEGFDDVMKFHPTHEDAPVAPKDAIPRIVTAPMADLQAAVDKKDRVTFEHAFDAVTEACNSCHRAMNFGFNMLQRPVANPYTNQVFALAP